jgi:5-methylcytosine-specific restriction endonuclease McrA
MENLINMKQKNVKISCLVCNKLMVVWPCLLKRGKKYCSEECQHRHQKLNLTGDNKKCLYCNCNFYVYKHQKKDKRGIYCSKKCQYSSELWKKSIGDANRSNILDSVFILRRQIRDSEIYNFWRNLVLKRDNYTCLLCNKRGGKLNVDHIIPFFYIIKINNITCFKEALLCEDLWSLDNGRTLCVGCHKSTDTYGEKVKHSNYYEDN